MILNCKVKDIIWLAFEYSILYEDSFAMELRLEEIFLAAAENARTIVIMDQAAWHPSGKLNLPDNITILPLPPKSPKLNPELNPVENLWPFVRDNGLLNKLFKSCNDILDHCCCTRNLLSDQPSKIMSIDMKEWDHRS